MVFQTDIAKYDVVVRKDGETLTYCFNTFSAAAGCADALVGLTRMINVRFSNEAGDSSISGSLYSYDKITNQRRVCNPYLVKEVSKRNGQ